MCELCTFLQIRSHNYIREILRTPAQNFLDEFCVGYAKLFLLGTMLRTPRKISLVYDVALA